MEEWSFSNYNKPRLVHMEAMLAEDSEAVIVSSAQGEFELACCGVPPCEVLDSIKAMSDPGSPIWDELAFGRAQPWQVGLAHQLDQCSLIGESEANAEKLPQQHDQLLKKVHIACDRLAEAIGANTNAYREVHDRIADLLSMPQATAGDFSWADMLAATEDNFALQTIYLQHLYVLDNLPVVAKLWKCMIASLAQRFGWPTSFDAAPSIAFREEVGLYSDRMIDAYIACLLDLLLLAGEAGARRRISVDSCPATVATGPNFMRCAEELARSCVERLGESAYARRIGAEDARFGPLVQGLFIEQFHVTTRFVEIIAPLMTKQVPAAIKQRVYQYFQEEIGHEAFEMATCEALGIDGRKLRQSIPLPLFVAYVDAFTILGKLDMTGYIASIMVTEGMMGAENPLHERLEELAASRVAYKQVAKRHDDLNIELNHASLSRLFFKEIKALSPQAQQRALDTLCYLIELNFRALDQAADFYAGQMQLSLCSLDAIVSRKR